MLVLEVGNLGKIGRAGGDEQAWDETARGGGSRENSAKQKRARTSSRGGPATERMGTRLKISLRLSRATRRQSAPHLGRANHSPSQYRYAVACGKPLPVLISQVLQTHRRHRSSLGATNNAPPILDAGRVGQGTACGMQGHDSMSMVSGSGILRDYPGSHESLFADKSSRLWDV